MRAEERDALEATLADLEQQLKAGLLYALEDSPAPGAPTPSARHWPPRSLRLEQCCSVRVIVPCVPCARVRVRVRLRGRGRVPADTPVPNLQESLLKIDTEIKEAHNVHQKLIKNTKTAASRFHAGE